MLNYSSIDGCHFVFVVRGECRSTLEALQNVQRTSTSSVCRLKPVEGEYIGTLNVLADLSG